MSSAPSPAAALHKLLEQEIGAMETMLGILREEQQALINADPRQLETVTTVKLKHYDVLKRLEAERETLFRTLGVAGTGSLIHSRLDTEFPGNALGERWQLLLELGRQCRELNRLNGMTIELGHHHVSQALRLVSGHGGHSDPCSYGPRGRRLETASSRLLGQA